MHNISDEELMLELYMIRHRYEFVFLEKLIKCLNIL